MKNLTMLPLKISKTRKRLSDNSGNLTIVVFAIIVVLTMAAYSFAVLSIRWAHGIVESKIPLIPASYNNLIFQETKISTSGEISNETPMVILTKKEFLFGTVNAFTTNLRSTGDKFSIPHVKNTPDMKTLIEQLRTWTDERDQQSVRKPQKIGILLPSAEIPMAIVIQVMAHLKNSGVFEDIVLGGGYKN